jgi:hypothetical protein
MGATAWALCEDYFRVVPRASNLYGWSAILAPIMDNWLIDYHHALQLRLAGLLIIFGVAFPALALVAVAARAVARRLMRRLAGAVRYAPPVPRPQLR